MLLTAQVRRIAFVLIALAIVGAPLVGSFPVSVPASVFITLAGLLLAFRLASDVFTATP